MRLFNIKGIPTSTDKFHSRKEKNRKMVDKRYLLTDAQMCHFIVNGYVIVNTDLPASFHDFIYERTEDVFEKEGNPGE